MNTDACNVEDISIHHVTECLSLSFVASFEDWSCLFRTWSFTLCKKWSGFERHFWFCFGVRIHLIVFNNESVRVLRDYIKSPCSFFHQCIRFPLLRRPNFINIPFWVAWWVSVYKGSHRSVMLLSSRAQRKLTFMFWFSRGFPMQWKVAHQESFRCIARPNSSSASILLWLFLHLDIFAFFSTSLQNNL